MRSPPRITFCRVRSSDSFGRARAGSSHGRSVLGCRLRRLILSVISALGLAVALLIGFSVADRLDRSVREFLERVGGAWGLAIVAGATILLLFVWLRFGGSQTLRRWGVVLKPIPPQARDDGAEESGGDSRARRRDPRSPTPR